MLTEARVCDAVTRGRVCGHPASRYVLVREGDRTGSAVDLCLEHARPLHTAFAQAETVELPARPRARMEATRLKTTPKTAHLKKEQDGQKAEGKQPEQA